MLRRVAVSIALTLTFCVAGLHVVPARAARIEAVPGKRYSLTRDNGPWMIMVASFHTTGADGRTEEGKSPEQAADELVLELRQKNVPAYVYAIESEPETIHTVDRIGRPDRRKPLRRVRSIGVLAGNYAGMDEKLAQRTLAWIKSYDPACLRDGVVFTPTDARPKPLTGAFLTINPLLSPEEVAASQFDPLLLRLNNGERYSVLENKGSYTLIVATFGGRSKIQRQGLHSDADSLNGSDLDAAARDARELVAAIRQHEKVDAYVWHDRYESIVTVGSFNSPDDPAIRALRHRFGSELPPGAVQQASAKILAIDPAGNRIHDVIDPSLQARVLNLGSTDQQAARQIARLWAFDPVPQLIRVPRAR